MDNSLRNTIEDLLRSTGFTTITMKDMEGWPKEPEKPAAPATLDDVLTAIKSLQGDVSRIYARQRLTLVVADVIVDAVKSLLITTSPKFTVVWYGPGGMAGTKEMSTVQYPTYGELAKFWAQEFRAVRCNHKDCAWLTLSMTLNDLEVTNPDAETVADSQVVVRLKEVPGAEAPTEQPTA